MPMTLESIRLYRMKPRPVWTEEERAEVVRYFDDGHTAAETSEKFGVPVPTVYTWTKTEGRGRKALIAGAAALLRAEKPPAGVTVRASGVAEDVQRELEALRVENGRLATENARLKKLMEAYKAIAEAMGGP